MAAHKNAERRSARPTPTLPVEPKPIANIAAERSGLPGGGAGRRDRVEPIPPGMRVDPDLTEGHPGYEESGGSEIMTPARFASAAAGPAKKEDAPPAKPPHEKKPAHRKQRSR